VFNFSDLNLELHITYPCESVNRSCYCPETRSRRRAEPPQCEVHWNGIRSKMASVHASHQVNPGVGQECTCVRVCGVRVLIFENDLVVSSSDIIHIFLVLDNLVFECDFRESDTTYT